MRLRDTVSEGGTEVQSSRPVSDTASEFPTASTALCDRLIDFPAMCEVCRDLETGRAGSNAFGAGYTPQVLKAHVEFWNGLSNFHKAVFARSVEAIPMDAMGGLMQPGKTLYHRSWSFSFWITVARIALNMYVTCKVIYHIELNDGRAVFGRHSQHRTEMWGDQVTFCDQRFNFTTQTKSSAELHCVHLPLHRLRAFLCISWFEVIALGLMVVYLAIVWLVFLICPETCNPLRRTPAAFIILPKITSKFSAVSFLQLLNFSRLRAVVCGEGLLAWVLLRHSLIPCGCGEIGKLGCKRFKDEPVSYTRMMGEDPDATSSDDEADSERSCCRGKCLSRFFTVVLCVGCAIAIAVGFQDLLAKLTAVHFAATTSFYRWDPHEWMMAAGFLNQMAGICWVDEIELIHIMMFKFGGSDCKWNTTRSRFCVEYMRLLVEKLAGVKGHLYRHHHKSSEGYNCPKFWYRVKAIALLANINATSVQLMLQSPARDEYLAERRKYALDRLKVHYDDEGVDDTKKEDAVDTNDPVRPEEVATCLKQNEELFEKEFKEFNVVWKDNGEAEAALKIVKRFSAEQLLRLAESREMVERWNEVEKNE